MRNREQLQLNFTNIQQDDTEKQLRRGLVKKIQ